MFFSLMGMTIACILLMRQVKEDRMDTSLFASWSLSSRNQVMGDRQKSKLRGTPDTALVESRFLE